MLLHGRVGLLKAQASCFWLLSPVARSAWNIARKPFAIGEWRRLRDSGNVSPWPIPAVMSRYYPDKSAVLFRCIVGIEHFYKIYIRSSNIVYQTVLALHSLVRWFVLISLLYALYRAYSGLFSKRAFSQLDNATRYWTAAIAHIQLVLGLWLYFISPIIEYFLHTYGDVVHQREVRFFGMEHSTTMLAAIVLITIGSAKAKRKQVDRDKYKAIAIWFTCAIVLILISIPWPFSPLANRLYFRRF